MVGQVVTLRIDHMQGKAVITGNKCKETGNINSPRKTSSKEDIGIQDKGESEGFCYDRDGMGVNMFPEEVILSVITKDPAEHWEGDS